LNDNQPILDAIRKLWYEENNKSTEGMDKRELGIHVGKKAAYIKCMNMISIRNGVKDASDTTPPRQ
jgi:hypothetical protein